MLVLSGCQISISSSSRYLPIDSSLLISADNLTTWTRRQGALEESCKGGFFHSEQNSTKSILNHEVRLCQNHELAQAYLSQTRKYISISPPPKKIDILIENKSPKFPNAEYAYAWCEFMSIKINSLDVSCVITLQYGVLVSKLDLLYDSKMNISPTFNELIEILSSKDALYYKEGNAYK